MKEAITPQAAAEIIPDGAVLAIGGFMGVGTPHRIVEALAEAGRRDLTIIGNDAGRPNFGIGRLVHERAVSKLIVSHIGLNPEAQKQMIEGDIEIDLVPQGTLVEQLRAAGYGLGGVLTKTALGTPEADGKRVIEIDGEDWLFEPPLKADFALIYADQADYIGNLTYQLTATNFNPIMAMAADTVICEPRVIVPVGVIPPDAVRTPGVLVKHLIARA